MLEVSQLIAEVNQLTESINLTLAQISRKRHLARYVMIHTLSFVAIPVALLLCAHGLLVIWLDKPELYLRAVSIVVPLPFGLFLRSMRKIGVIETAFLGLLTGAVAVLGMSEANVIAGFTGFVLPQTHAEWWQDLEYTASIGSSFVAGNLLGLAFYRIAHARNNRAHPLAFFVARLLGDDLGEDELRRRAWLVQEFAITVGPIAGSLGSIAVAIYTGIVRFLQA